MIGRAHRLQAARLTAPRERPDFHFRLGIEGNAKGFRIARRPLVGLPDVAEEGLGLGDFF